MDTNFKKILLETNNTIWAKDNYLYNQVLACVHTPGYKFAFNCYVPSSSLDKILFIGIKKIELESIYSIHLVSWNKISTQI